MKLHHPARWIDATGKDRAAVAVAGRFEPESIEDDVVLAEVRVLLRAESLAAWQAGNRHAMPLVTIALALGLVAGVLLGRWWA